MGKTATQEKPKTSTRGGARAGAGQKPKTVQDATGESFVLYSKARAKKETHNAMMAELDERKKRGQLVDVDTVNQQADSAARAVRDAFLSLPDRLSSLLVGRTEKQINAELLKEIRQTLTAVSNEISQ